MNGIPLTQRRRHELASKIQSLDLELADWKLRTEQPGFRRHYRQVRRLTATLEGLIEPLRVRLKSRVSDAELLAHASQWETEALTAHTIWEVFRSKLVLRQSELFRDYLAACDDFAFACYQPARDRFTQNPKEPPLVYLSATWSPFAVSRDGNFQNEIRAARGTGGYLAQPEFQQVLNKLPIPLLSIPWYQVALLPCALILAHEVGHIVEWDFGLTGLIAEAMGRAQLDHEAVWLEWASEVFADLYGCLSAGPAFVGTLMDLLAASTEAIQAEERESGKYPTRYLRIELCLATLDALNLNGEAQRLRQDWTSAYGPMTKMTHYLPDLKKVVQHLITGPYYGLSLREVVTPPAVDAGVIGKTALLKMPLQTPWKEARAIFSAARWLQENHADSAQIQSACVHLRDQLVDATKDEFRGSLPHNTDPKKEEEVLARQAAGDRDLGAALLMQLGG